MESSTQPHGPRSTTNSATTAPPTVPRRRYALRNVLTGSGHSSFALYRMPLDFAPTQIIPILSATSSGLAYTANDERLIHVVPSVDYVDFEGTPPTTVVFGQSAPVALGSVDGTADLGRAGWRRWV